MCFSLLICSSSLIRNLYKFRSNMDRKWMFANRLSEEYVKGVDYFVNFAVRRLGTSRKFKCPCLTCCYDNRVTGSELELPKLYLLDNAW